MEQCKTDPCVFRKCRDGRMVILTMHVDDMTVAGTVDEVRQLHDVLNEDFTTNDLLPLFTGCVAAQNVEEGHLSISQTAFIETLAKRLNVSTISKFLASVGANLEARKEGESGDPWAFREAVGSMM